MFRKYAKEIFVLLFVLALFLFASYFSHVYNDVLIKSLGDYGAASMAIYIVGATITTVIAPLSFLPALPIAVTLWGSTLAALLSIIAWSLGAAIAFLLARRYGQPLVRHFVGEQRMKYLSGFLPSHRIFLAVMLLRIVFPVDFLSYALGLFNVIRFWPYMAATVIGITPFAFIFANLASIPVLLQVGVFLGGLIVIALMFPSMKRRYKRMFLQEKEEAEI